MNPNSRAGPHTKARLLALVGVVAISFSAIFVRLADVSPATASFFRTAYALPPLFLIVLWQRHGNWGGGKARWLAYAAGVFLALDLYLWHHSISLIGAGLATILANTQVFFVGLAAWAIHRERPHRNTFLTIPILFLGVTLISGLSRPGAFGTSPIWGTVIGIGSGMAYTVFLLLFRASNRDQNRGSSSLLEVTLATSLATLVGGLTLGELDLTPSWPAHGWLFTLACFSHVGGWLFISFALPRLAALEGSLLLVLQPVLTVFWAVPIFREWLSAVQWAGVVLVLSCVAFLSIRGSVQQSETAGRPETPSGREAALGAKAST